MPTHIDTAVPGVIVGGSIVGTTKAEPLQIRDVLPRWSQLMTAKHLERAFLSFKLAGEEESINILAMTVANVLPSGGAGIAAPAQFNVPTLRFSRALVRSPHRLLGTKERTVDAKIAMVTPKPSFMMKLSCLLMLEILYEKKDGFLVLSIR